MADIAKINGLNLKDAQARTDIAGIKSGTITVGNASSADSAANGITLLPARYIRITDLSTGVYKLTYNATKYIYYNGANSTSSISINGSSGAVILTVSKHSISYWTWSYINNNGSSTIYLCYGYTTSSAGSWREITLPSVSTGTLATTALATTSEAGLMSATDKTKINSVLQYKTSGSCSAFGGTAYYIIYSDGSYHYLSIYGMTGNVSDGGQATWNIPSSFSSTYGITAREIGISLTQVQSGGRDEYKNGVDVEGITDTALIIKSNTNTTSRFLFVGFGRS